MKFSIITDRPNESSDSSEIEVVLESNEVSIDSSSNEEFSNALNVSNVPSEVSHNTFVVVKVYRPSSLRNCRNFIAKIISGPDSDDDYEVAFLKRCSKVKSGFIFPVEKDLAIVSYCDIIFLLQPPSPVAQTARLSNIFRLADDWSRFNTTI